MKNKICILLAILLCAGILYGCVSESQTATNETIDQADNFQLVRELVVYNTRSDKPICRLVANFSFNVDETDEQLEVICKTEDTEGNAIYKRHLIGYNRDTIHMVNDLSDKDYGLTHYEFYDYRTLDDSERGIQSAGKNE